MSPILRGNKRGGMLKRQTLKSDENAREGAAIIVFLIGSVNGAGWT